MRIVHSIIAILFWAFIAIVGFFLGWNLRAYKARKDAKLI